MPGPREGSVHQRFLAGEGPNSTRDQTSITALAALVVCALVMLVAGCGGDYGERPERTPAQIENEDERRERARRERERERRERERGRRERGGRERTGGGAGGRRGRADGGAGRAGSGEMLGTPASASRAVETVAKVESSPAKASSCVGGNKKRASLASTRFWWSMPRTRPRPSLSRGQAGGEVAASKLPDKAILPSGALAP